MKDEYTKKNTTQVVGTLDFDEDTNRFFVRIEEKDEVIVKDLVDDILNELIGCQIKIYSEENRV